LAFAQMEDWYKRILSREVKSGETGKKSSKVRVATLWFTKE